MKRLFYVTGLFILMFLASCASRMQMDVKPHNVSYQEIQKKNIAKVVILPFYNCNISKFDKLNLILYDDLSDVLIKHNFIPVPYDEIVSLIYKNSESEEVKISDSLLAELNNPLWSNEMKKEIENIIYTDEKYYKSRKKNCTSIDQNEIINIGEKYSAKFVIKALITEFEFLNEETFNPFKIGFLNTPAKLISRTMYGKPSSDNWGKFQNMISSGLLGGIIGYNLGEPFDSRSYKNVKVGHPYLGYTIRQRSGGDSDHKWKNGLFWGGTAALNGLIASYSGDFKYLNVGIRLYVYDVDTKQLVWTDRVKLRIEPESMYANVNEDDLINSAVKEGVSLLMASFFGE